MSADLDSARRRLAELVTVCEAKNTGDGVMAFPLEEARQLGADLRALLDAGRAELIPSIEEALFTKTPEQHACLDREMLGGLVRRLLELWAVNGIDGRVVHRAPTGGLSPFNCCGLHPPDVPDVDCITWTDDLVSCEGG